MLTWSTTIVREAWDRFRQNFAMGSRAYPLWYKGVNLGISIATHREARAIAKARMKARGACCNKIATICLGVAYFEGNAAGGGGG